MKKTYIKPVTDVVKTYCVTRLLESSPVEIPFVDDENIDWDTGGGN